MGAARRDASLTGSAMLVGSVHYMAPEQIRSASVVDARADVWSLGVCLYQMLTRTLPFEGDSLVSVCAAIQGRPPIDVRERASHVPPDLGAAVMRALEKDVRRRFATVAELAAALAPFTDDVAAASRIATILGAAPPPTSQPPPTFPTLLSSAPPPYAPLARGRIESTIGVAAVGTPAAFAPLPRRRWWPGMLLAGAAFAMIASWMRFGPGTDRGVVSSVTTLEAPVESAPAANVAAPPPSPAPPAPAPTATTTATASSSVVTTTALPAHVRRGQRRPTFPPISPLAPLSPASEPSAAPKPEASGAYDRF